MPDQADWAYIAGIIDGEGYLSIAAHILASGKTYSIRPVLHIGNSDKRILEFCQEFLGGNICVATKGRKTPFYRLEFQGKKLEEPLNQLLPYLISKKKVAELILEYIALHNSYYPRTKGYTIEEIKLANQVRQMSRKNGHRARQIPLNSVTVKPKTATQKEVNYNGRLI